VVKSQFFEVRREENMGACMAHGSGWSTRATHTWLFCLFGVKPNRCANLRITAHATACHRCQCSWLWRSVVSESVWWVDGVWVGAPRGVAGSLAWKTGKI